jgi:hypothetical protein
MVELGRMSKGLPGRVVAKLEMRNPCAPPPSPSLPDGLHCASRERPRSRPRP